MDSQLTVYAIVPERSKWDTCAGAGVDSAWEREKLEARKMLVNRARPKGSPTRQEQALLGGIDEIDQVRRATKTIMRLVSIKGSRSQLPYICSIAKPAFINESINSAL